jgi:type I restriction enzyme, R subunit
MNHHEEDVIRRLRQNQPLSPAGVERLEGILIQIDEEDGKELLAGLLKRSQAQTLAHFVRTLVGVDTPAAQSAFSDCLSDRSLTAQTTRLSRW